MDFPKSYIAKYSEILDSCVGDFFEFYNGMFAKTEAGKYAFAEAKGKAWFEGVFNGLVAKKIREFARPYDRQKPEYWFVAGGCDPRGNILLFHKKKYFPEKLDRTVSEGKVRYELRESDIDIDMAAACEAFESSFDRMFRREKGSFGGGDVPKNVFFVKHADLDERLVARIVSKACGGAEEVNIERGRTCLTPVNDMISRYSYVKELAYSSRFAADVAEITAFVEEKVKSANG